MDRWKLVLVTFLKSHRTYITKIAVSAFSIMKTFDVIKDTIPPLNPDQPIVLSFYPPFHRPGLDPKAQVAMGRAELLSRSYKQYESKILKQMLRLFGSAGFDPERDVAGLILNRWGHAYSVPYPGFFGGASGQGPSDVLRRNGGRGPVGTRRYGGSGVSSKLWILLRTHAVNSPSDTEPSATPRIVRTFSEGEDVSS